MKSGWPMIWEYKVVDILSPLGLCPEVGEAILFAESILKPLGDEGWELIAVRGCLAFLKRTVFRRSGPSGYVAT